MVWPKGLLKKMKLVSSYFRTIATLFSYEQSDFISAYK